MVLNNTVENERTTLEGGKWAKKSDNLQGAEEWRGKSTHNLN